MGSVNGDSGNGDSANGAKSVTKPSVVTAAAQRTERAINVLREALKSATYSPAITATSTGVMINYARELVRKST